MKITRRNFVQTAAAACVTAPLLDSSGGAENRRLAAGATNAHAGDVAQETRLPPAFDSLQPLGDKVHPIEAKEYQARIARAQQLLTDVKPDYAALYVAPGSSMVYFTGIHWWPSERLLALLIPQKGDPLLVSPAFEEGRLREQLHWPIEIRVWQEDESPYRLAAVWLKSKKVAAGRIAVESQTPYVFYDGLRKSYPYPEYLTADPIMLGCRARKSENELALMRQACQATFSVYKATFGSLKEGMKQSEVAALISAGYEKMGLSGDALVLFGRGAALPHGTREDLQLREGDGILIDGGTTVEGYQSDVTRTSSLGKPSDKLQRAFDIVRKAQDAALAAAVKGKPCGSVDDAARAVITKAGFGPGYKYFTHRLGHGIGLDMHEQPYLVRGNRVILEPSMTFSDEPGIYVPGDYGLRCEDDMAISEDGEAKLLTPGFAPSLTTPIA
jgi:Xaa-Pro dipeptidase